MLQYSDDNMLGPYKIVRKLGEGGMGTVYLAFDETLARHVAIKVLRLDADPDGSAAVAMARRFEREAQTAAKLKHPNIVTIYTVGRQGGGTQENGRPYMVMEYLEAGSLADQLHKNGPLPWRKAAEVMADALLALAAAHEAGIVHRDVKPTNLMWSAAGGRGGVKLVDFGLARALYGPADAEITFPGMFVGSASYASPEQINGTERIDARSDIYSLAATGYALLTGQPPFVDDDSAEVMRQHATEPFPDVRELAPEVPEEWVRVFERAGRKNPAERYADAMEMHAAMTRLLRLPESWQSESPHPVAAKATKVSESLAMLESQLAAAQSSRDESMQLSTLRSLCGLYSQLERPEQAKEAFRRALVLHVKMCQPRLAE
ncbi:MAG: serine/threonine protein kinase [Phycisphaerales bacterium]|nr:serine/threonine protein kinase [Phycisphaerales bacterium]